MPILWYHKNPSQIAQRKAYGSRENLNRTVLLQSARQPGKRYKSSGYLNHCGSRLSTEVMYHHQPSTHLVMAWAEYSTAMQHHRNIVPGYIAFEWQYPAPGHLIAPKSFST